MQHPEWIFKINYERVGPYFQNNNYGFHQMKRKMVLINDPGRSRTRHYLLVGGGGGMSFEIRISSPKNGASVFDNIVKKKGQGGEVQITKKLFLNFE